MSQLNSTQVYLKAVAERLKRYNAVQWTINSKNTIKRLCTYCIFVLLVYSLCSFSTLILLVGSLTCKTISQISYTVFVEALNTAQSNPVGWGGDTLLIPSHSEPETLDALD